MSVTAPAGFEAGGVACAIKPAGALDLALVAVAPGPGGRRAAVPAAAAFTANRAQAAPVLVSRGQLASNGGRAAAVVINSGNANAATGTAGLAHARSTCAEAAALLGVAEDEVLVCSTGLIGIPLRYEATIQVGLAGLVGSLSGGPGAAQLAARAIMTTDTRPRQTLVEGPGYLVGGMAKGAAMLAPRLAVPGPAGATLPSATMPSATMLAVLTTDALVSQAVLASCLSAAVSGTFNQLSVDGSCSTNDTVIVLASGLAGTPPPGERSLTASLTEACASLAAQMAADAEGANLVATVTVTGAASDAEAAAAARQVAQSQLVQCSLHGRDPYWGRVVSELGSAGVTFELERVSVAYGGVTVCRDGAPAVFDAAGLAAHMAGDRVQITADLGLGLGQASIVTTDLSPAYIAENMSTS